jgi:hypothetical protein
VVCLAACGHAFTPLNDLGTGSYLNQFQGGLYPNGSNQIPASHRSEGIARAAAIQPLNTAGQPDPAGKYVLLSIGMSNATQEFSGGNGPTAFSAYSFMGQAAFYPTVNHDKLVIFNGARGGQTTSTWDSPTDTNYTNIADALTNNGLSEAQVSAVWVKTANAGPSVSLPSAQADAYALKTGFGNIARTLKTRYPNLQLVFYSSRTYAGYATTQLNPEPYAYESGLAIKWVIESQVRQMDGLGIDPQAGDLDYTSAAPLLAWGPYLWGDGMNPRSDGLVWQQSDFGNDGTHPSNAGRAKVGSMLLNFMLNSDLTRPWFVNPDATALPGDADNDGEVDIQDLGRLASNWQRLGNWAMGDFTLDGVIDVQDLGILASNWQAGVSGSFDADQPSEGFADALRALGLPAPVPEASTITCMAGPSLLLMRRRRAGLDLTSPDA